MPWAASSDLVPTLDKTKIMNIETNNSINSSIHISFFAMHLCTYNNSNSRENCGGGLDPPRIFETGKKEIFYKLVVLHNY